jgi:twitching motility protein PilT
MSTAAEVPLLGRIALHYKMITAEQLQQALERQSRDPAKKVGEALLDMGLITREQLDWLLNAQTQMAKKAQAQQAVAPAQPAAPAPVQPAASAPRPQAAAAAGFTKMPSLEQILTRAVDAKASDVHIHAGAPLQMRLNGQLKELKVGLLEAAQTEALVFSALTEQQKELAKKHQDLDFALQLPAGRFRANLYKQQRGWDAVFRPIPSQPPTLQELGLPPMLKRLTEWHQGLVLVTGPAGCGKSSTLAALVNLINESRKEHVITVEDPIEYVHPSKACVVNQRQAGKHTLTFANALRAALREDPDVIVIGELRDLETIALAITAAETGHLVLATLHTNSAIRTINRILDVFPPKQQSQIRAMVSESLKAIVSQRLVPTADGARRVPALEVLFVKPSVSNLIREEKTFQIRSVMQTGRSEGMSLLDDSLAELVKAGTITKETARRSCEDPKRFV